MHLDLVGTARGSIVASGVLVRTDQLFFLGVDRDHRLTGRLCGNDGGVDVLELGVTDGIATAFQGLAVHLPAITQLAQQLECCSWQPGAPSHAVSSPTSRGSSIPTAAVASDRPSLPVPATGAGPQAACAIRDGLNACLPLPGRRNHTGQRARIIKVPQTTTYRAAGDPGCTRRRADPAMTRCSCLSRRKQPPTPLVQAPTNPRIAFANR